MPRAAAACGWPGGARRLFALALPRGLSTIADGSSSPAQGASPLGGLRLGFARAAAARTARRAAGPQPPKPPAAAEATASNGNVTAAPIVVVAGDEESGDLRVPISFLRQAVAQRQRAVKDTLAHTTTFQEVDVTAALALRERYGKVFRETHAARLGLLSLYVRACVTALQAMPNVNAVIDEDAQELVYREYMDISVPIPSPRGPISCVLSNAEMMSIGEVEVRLVELAEKAAQGTLLLEDVAGATFGIVDNGVAGGLLGTALINPPASAVLGTNAIAMRAVVIDDKIVARSVAYMSLTYDHRIVDGREGVTFLARVRDKMEDPASLLLDL